jgi:hypothetical protein
MWQLIATWVITAVLAYALRPKPKAQAPAAPATIEDVDAPTAEEGREIPVLFGTRKISAPNVVWYGDLDTTPIEQCQTTKSGGFFGLFSSSSTQCSIVGYKYYLGVHFVLSHGPIDSLNRIDVMERIVWTAPGPSVEDCDILGRDSSGSGDAARSIIGLTYIDVHTILVTTEATHGLSDGEIIEFNTINGSSFGPELSDRTYVAGSHSSANRFYIYTNISFEITDQSEFEVTLAAGTELYERSQLSRLNAQQTVSGLQQVSGGTQLTVDSHGYSDGQRIYVYFGYGWKIDGFTSGSGGWDVKGVFEIRDVSATTFVIDLVLNPGIGEEGYPDPYLVPKSGSGSDFGFVDGVA